jgi:Uma2 family endonuclease
MATAVKLGPADHGRPMSLGEFMAADYDEGYQYELIEGKLYVSPLPDPPQDCGERWLNFKLQMYAHNYPDVINYVTPKARVFVPGRRRVTSPEPDLAAFRGFPLHKLWRELRWQDVSPILVGEVLSANDPDKDLVRNKEVYFQVPSIKEYWILDTLEDPEQPTMRVHRRHGKRWRVIDLAYGDTYTTRLLPGFELLLDPRT